MDPAEDIEAYAKVLIREDYKKHTAIATAFHAAATGSGS